MIKLATILSEIKILPLNPKSIIDLISNIKTDIVNFLPEEGWKKDWLMRKVNKILSKYKLSNNSLKKNLQELESFNKIELTNIYLELKKFQDNKDNWERDMFDNIGVEEIKNLASGKKLKIIDSNSDTGFGYNTAFNKVKELDGWPIFRNAKNEWVFAYMDGYYVEKISEGLKTLGIPHKFIKNMEIVTVPDKFVEIVQDI